QRHFANPDIRHNRHKRASLRAVERATPNSHETAGDARFYCMDAPGSSTAPGWPLFPRTLVLAAAFLRFSPQQVPAKLLRQAGLAGCGIGGRLVREARLGRLPLLRLFDPGLFITRFHARFHLPSRPMCYQAGTKISIY